MEIRDATPDDAEAACDVLRRSISELCVADHGNDAAILRDWLLNKTPEIVAGWATQPKNSLLVAVEGDAILAVGSVTDAGEITLCRHRGNRNFGIVRQRSDDSIGPKRHACR